MDNTSNNYIILQNLTTSTLTDLTIYESSKFGIYLPVCPICEDTLHTRSQAKACKKQNSNLITSSVWKRKDLTWYQRLYFLSIWWL